MRVAIDARPAVSAGMTGVGFYTRELIRRLPEVDPGTTYVPWYLNARRAIRPWRWNRRFFPPNVEERWTPFPATWFERLSLTAELPLLEWLLRFDVLFAPNFIPPPTRSRRLVVTVHDLAYRRFPETAPQATRKWLGRMDRTLRQAAEIIAVSEATKRDLVELDRVDPSRVSVIHHGVDHERYRPPPPEEVDRVRRIFGLDGPYVVFVGGIEPRKNLPALARAFATLGGDLRLVVAGSWVPWNPEGRSDLSRTLGGLPAQVRARIAFTGYVSERDKVGLLGGAEALVFPSLYEGFGFPVVEAMACGTPVLTSIGSSLPEIAGDAALLVDPRDEEAIAEGIRRLVEDGDLRSRLRERGLVRAQDFRWEETARRTAEVLGRA